MDLVEYARAEQEDGNLFWKLQAGDHLNLLDEAIEIISEKDKRIKELEAEIRRLIDWQARAVELFKRTPFRVSDTGTKRRELQSDIRKLIADFGFFASPQRKGGE